MKNELLLIAQRTTIFINDFKNLNEDNDMNKRQSLLVEFVQTLFEQFKQVAQAHSILLKFFARAISAHKIDIKPYDMDLFWSQIQLVVSNVQITQFKTF